MVNEQELIELLRKTTAASEKMISAWEDQYEISTELKATIEKANKLLQKLDQDKAFQEEPDILPEWHLKKYEPSLDELMYRRSIRKLKQEMILKGSSGVITSYSFSVQPNTRR